MGHWGIVDSRNRGAVASSSRDHSIVEKRFYNKTDSNGHGHHDVRLGMFDNFSTYLNLLLFVILTMLIEAGHGLLIQVGKQLNQRPRSRRLINMADIFAGQFKLMATSLILTVLSVVLQNVTESWSFSGLPGQLSSLAGYRAAFLVFLSLLS